MGTVQPVDLIRWARDAIGEGDSATDWRIEPTEHAKLFATSAPSLAEDLRGERPQGLAEIYEQSNGQANRDRDSFKATVGKANRAVFFTAVFSALLLVMAGLQTHLGTVGPWAAKVIGPLGLLSAGLATMWLNQVRERSLSQRWAESRAKAEAKRLAYFKAVMEAASQDGQAQLLALEYTRRFLLDNQINYFHQRGQQHQRAADQALNHSTQAVFVASSFTALAGFLVMWDPRLAVLAGLGVIASAYAAYVASRSAVNQDRENAERYRAAEDQLRERKLDLDAYRQRAAAGDLSAVQEFFAAIFLTLEADHKGFLTDSEKREFAIGNMEQRLDAARESISSAH
jgi:hypothetical protein